MTFYLISLCQTKWLNDCLYSGRLMFVMRNTGTVLNIFVFNCNRFLKICMSKITLRTILFLISIDTHCNCPYQRHWYNVNKNVWRNYNNFHKPFLSNFSFLYYIMYIIMCTEFRLTVFNTATLLLPYLSF